MFKKISLIILCLILVTACSAKPTATVTVEETIVPKPEPTSQIGNTAPSEGISPTEAVSEPVQPSVPYPVAGEESQSEPVSAVVPYPLPVTGFEPREVDETLTRGVAYIEIANSGLMFQEGYPLQVLIHMTGNLPTPCHQLRMVVTPDYAKMRVDVDAYSVIDSTQVCAEMLQPLDQILPLGVFSGGSYTVYLNGEMLGTFDS